LVLVERSLFIRKLTLRALQLGKFALRI